MIKLAMMPRAAPNAIPALIFLKADPMSILPPTPMGKKIKFYLNLIIFIGHMSLQFF